MRFFFSGHKKTSLKIEVEDNGNGKKPQNADSMKALQQTKVSEWFDNHDSIRGRWLFMIIFNLVDSLYFKDSETGGLIVGVEKDFS